MKKTTHQSQKNIGCVIMAAGNSRRFGENKLIALVNGKPLVEYAFKAMPSEKLQAVCVVTRYDEIEALSAQYGLLCIRNNRPEDGLSHTIRLGTKALSEKSEAILYMVSDQPLIRRESIANLIDFYCEHPGHIVSAASDGKRGNPCIFPKKYFPELMALKGDIGGSSVIRSHEDDLLLFDIPREELADIDTPEALNYLFSS